MSDIGLPPKQWVSHVMSPKSTYSHIKLCDHFNFIGRCDSKMIRLVSDVGLVRPGGVAWGSLG